ncbi:MULTISPECIES: hypothetical protein [Pseudarthrobacter]|uniref:hypothetical protein n=1 Tax=Pseudarthrobacter TaxID=1742993 RepID=UPI00208F64CB|nr:MULTISPECIES: hypothetical protein [unclassified Pseudarthrobacter]MCO4250461.1 hypothetical protein [Pseudarthrobacter sp. MDT3-9]
MRQGRAIAWISEALAPLQGQWAGQDIQRLVLAIRSATGIESLVWLTDVGGLSREYDAALGPEGYILGLIRSHQGGRCAM